MLAMIALANVMIYLHDRPYGLRQHVLTGNVLDQVVSAGFGLFVDARAYPLFAALFGYGIVQMIRSRQVRGMAEGEIRRIVRRRSVGLILFGAVHAVLAFSGDILGWYGLIGLALLRLLHLQDRALLRLAIISLAVAATVQAAIFADPTPTVQRSYFWSYAISEPLEAAGWPLPWRSPTDADRPEPALPRASAEHGSCRGGLHQLAVLGQHSSLEAVRHRRPAFFARLELGRVH